jgi:hypothetical protein
MPIAGALLFCRLPLMRCRIPTHTKAGYEQMYRAQDRDLLAAMPHDRDGVSTKKNVNRPLHVLHDTL